MWELDHKESWAPKNWCLWTVELEKTPQSPLDCKEIKPVNPKGNQSWIFIERTDAEAEVPIFWPPDAKNWLIGKDPDAGKDWGQEEKGTTVDEMVGWHHKLDGHEFEQTPGISDGQGSVACCSPWSHKESDTTGATWTELNAYFALPLAFFIVLLPERVYFQLQASFTQYGPFSKSIPFVAGKATLLNVSQAGTLTALNPTVVTQLSKSNNASETLHNLSTQSRLWFNSIPLYLLSRNAPTCAYTL